MIHHDEEIYLDNAATTRPHPHVIRAVSMVLSEEYGNPSSIHGKGLAAERVITAAREAVARSLGVSPDTIVFASGGTEANNLAIFGVALRGKRRHILTSVVEHSSVLSPIRRLVEQGFEVTEVPVDAEGRVHPESIADSLRPNTALVSIMAVNNELGTIQPIEHIGRIIRLHNAGGGKAFFHVDAVQAWGKVPLRPLAAGVDLMAVSGHKVHGPKGVGALYVRKGIRLASMQAGGDQERGIRPGTENVPGIAGIGAAATLLHSDLEAVSERVSTLRDRLREQLAAIADVRVNTPVNGSAPHILNVSFAGVRGETLLHRLEQDGIYVSTGSACHSHDPTPSHVLLAIGLSPDVAVTSLRFSLSRDTTAEDIDAAAAAVRAAVAELRTLVR
ncbi:MAG: cysteine desulfurase family protein [bacterium]